MAAQQDDDTYINGVVSAIGYWPQQFERFFGGCYEWLYLYNRSLNDVELKSFHNKYARRPYLILDFENDSVGDTI